MTRKIEEIITLVQIGIYEEEEKRKRKRKKKKEKRRKEKRKRKNKVQNGGSEEDGERRYRVRNNDYFSGTRARKLIFLQEDCYISNHFLCVYLKLTKFPGKQVAELLSFPSQKEEHNKFKLS